MIKYRPGVHCPHIGYDIIATSSSYTNIHTSPSGGGMCVQRDVCISLFLAVFCLAEVPYQQYIAETTQKLYPVPFLPLSLG